MKYIVYALAVVLFVLHQDFWNFQKHDPLWLGIIPIGLWYHALFAVACSVLLLLMVIFLALGYSLAVLAMPFILHILMVILQFMGMLSVLARLWPN